MTLPKPSPKRTKREDHTDYWYWPQCDVQGCEGVSACNGMYWRPGYWCLCSQHSDAARAGGEKPKMKRRSVTRENRRNNETGIVE